MSDYSQRVKELYNEFPAWLHQYFKSLGDLRELIHWFTAIEQIYNKFLKDSGQAFSNLNMIWVVCLISTMMLSRASCQQISRSSEQGLEIGLKFLKNQTSRNGICLILSWLFPYWLIMLWKQQWRLSHPVVLLLFLSRKVDRMLRIQ